MCGSIQIVLDSFVIGQTMYYNRKEKNMNDKENKSFIMVGKKSKKSSVSSSSLTRSRRQSPNKSKLGSI